MEMNDGFEVWLNEPKCEKEFPLKYFMGEMYPKVSTDEDKRLPLFGEDFAEYFSDLFDEKDVAVLNNEMRMRFNHLKVKKKFYTKVNTKEIQYSDTVNYVKVTRNESTKNLVFTFEYTWTGNTYVKTQEIITDRLTDITATVYFFYDENGEVHYDFELYEPYYTTQLFTATIIRDPYNGKWLLRGSLDYFYDQYIVQDKSANYAGVSATRSYESVGVNGLINFTVGNESFNKFYDVQPPSDLTIALVCIYTNVNGDIYYNYKDEAPTGYNKIASWSIRRDTTHNIWSEYVAPTYYEGTFERIIQIPVDTIGIPFIGGSNSGVKVSFNYEIDYDIRTANEFIEPQGDLEDRTVTFYVDTSLMLHWTFGTVPASSAKLFEFTIKYRNNSWQLASCFTYFVYVHTVSYSIPPQISRELTLSNMEDTCIMIGAKHEDEWTMFKRIANKYNSLSADDLVKTVDIEREMENSDVESGSIDIDNTKTPNNWKETETPSGTTKSTTTNSRTPNTTDDTFYKQTKSEVDTSFNQYKTEREQTGTFDDNTTTTFNDHTHKQDGTASEKGYRGRDYGATLERAFKRRGLEWLDKVLNDLVPNLLIMCEEI